MSLTTAEPRHSPGQARRWVVVLVLGMGVVSLVPDGEGINPGTGDTVPGNVSMDLEAESVDPDTVSIDPETDRGVPDAESIDPETDRVVPVG